MALSEAKINQHVAKLESKDTKDFLKNQTTASRIVFEKGLSNWLDIIIALEYPKSNLRVAERKVPTNYYETFVNKVSNTHAVEPTYFLQNKLATKVLSDKFENAEWHNKMISAQHVLNTCCCIYAEPYTSDEIQGPSVRIYRGNEFEAMYDSSSAEPNIPVAIVKYLGSGSDKQGAFTFHESVDKDHIARYIVRDSRVENLIIRDNPMGELPGVYAQLSLFGKKGDPDVELLLLTKVYNTNIADLNFTFKYMNHPARIAKNMQLPEGESLDFNVDTIIEAKTRRSDGKDPTIETIFTEVDYDAGFTYNQNVAIAFFLARGATLKLDQPSERPLSGAVADMEMFDLTAIWEKQKSLFGGFEKKLIKKFVKYNNLFKSDFKDNRELPEDGKLKIDYADSKDFTSKGIRLDNAAKENTLGITTKRKMIADVNPNFTIEQVEELSEAAELEVVEPETENTETDNGDS